MHRSLRTGKMAQCRLALHVGRNARGHTASERPIVIATVLNQSSDRTSRRPWSSFCPFKSRGQLWRQCPTSVLRMRRFSKTIEVELERKLSKYEIPTENFQRGFRVSKHYATDARDTKRHLDECDCAVESCSGILDGAGVAKCNPHPSLIQALWSRIRKAWMNSSSNPTSCVSYQFTPHVEAIG